MHHFKNKVFIYVFGKVDENILNITLICAVDHNSGTGSAGQRLQLVLVHPL